ncbi:recombinase family protein [Halococcus sediminicola]|uniref:recombinase family protein n=1 Tax=Halococcus sediminicola TaxID=1264579 RepID=UPI0019298476
MRTDTAVGYIRLSQDGKSLARQRRDVENYATEYGIELIRVYDEGKRSSGFDTDRPEYTALCDHIADGTVDTVIVPNLSHLSRDRKERLRLLLEVDGLVSRSTRSNSAARSTSMMTGHSSTIDPGNHRRWRFRRGIC